LPSGDLTYEIRTAQRQQPPYRIGSKGFKWPAKDPHRGGLSRWQWEILRLTSATLAAGLRPKANNGLYLVN